MADWITWLMLAGIVVILEMLSGTFYLLMIGIGLMAGSLAAVVGMSNAQQVIMAAIVGIIATFALRRSKFGKLNKIDAARDPNVNLDIGQTLTIQDWQGDGNNPGTARVMYRGAMWDVELAQGETARPGAFVIREIQGSRLIVSHRASNNN